jgi:hypothetical protein
MAPPRSSGPIIHQSAARRYNAADENPVRRVAVGQLECQLQRLAPRYRQALDAVEHRRAKLVQAGERQFHLREPGELHPRPPDREGHLEARQHRRHDVPASDVVCELGGEAGYRDQYGPRARAND